MLGQKVTITKIRYVKFALLLRRIACETEAKQTQLHWYLKYVLKISLTKWEENLWARDLVETYGLISLDICWFACVSGWYPVWVPIQMKVSDIKLEDFEVNKILILGEHPHLPFNDITPPVVSKTQIFFFQYCFI